MKRILRMPFGIPSVLITVVVLVITLKPFSSDNNIQLFNGADKVVHFIMFFVVGCIYILDYTKKAYPRHLKIDKYIAITIFCCFLGALIEFTQDTMGLGRRMELSDFIANCLGAVVAFLFFKFYFASKFRSFLKKKGYRRDLFKNL